MKKIYPLLAISFFSAAAANASSPISESLFSRQSDLELALKEAPKHSAARIAVNLDEWMDYGEAQFKDCWLLPGLGEQFQETAPYQTVKIMKHRFIDGDYLLVDPYSGSYFSELLETSFLGYAETPGYIRFNVANPECVYVYPFVGSGAYSELFGDGNMYEFLNYNTEGYYEEIYGYSTEQIIELFDANSLNLSYYDGETAYIYNSKFGLTGSPMANYGWNNLDGTPMLCIGEIKFVADGPATGEMEEWSDFGEAQFKDSWLLAGLGEEVQEDAPYQTVKIMKSNYVEGDYLLVDPYAGEYFEEILQSSFLGYAESPGAIRFNISNPDCVYVYPFVASGAYSELFGDGNMYEFYSYNLEGYYVSIYNYTTEEVIELFDSATINVSYYDGDTAYIYNSRFGLTGSLPANYGWNNLDGSPRVCIGEIKFDANGPETGVDTTVHPIDAPVRYFNLQGVELQNPSKGEIIIKVEGNKSSKMIAR